MIYLNLDLNGILNVGEELRPRAEKAMKQAAEELAIQTHAHILEQSQQHLNSTREKYADALNFQQVDDNTWLVTLDKSAMWIEEGMQSREMIDDLLKSPKAKTAKDGSRYMAVPFQHNKGPTQSTQAQQDLTNTVKAELKKRNIPYGKLEKDQSGKVKTGTLHSFDIMGKPPKVAEGPGQGHGPIGAVRQGMTGIPFLQGVRVIQKEHKGENGKSTFSRHIMTFRMVSSKHKGSGRWVHPGIDAKKFFDSAADWALTQWNENILPQILKGLTERL